MDYECGDGMEDGRICATQKILVGLRRDKSIKKVYCNAWCITPLVYNPHFWLPMQFALLYNPMGGYTRDN